MTSALDEALEWFNRSEQAREVAGQLTDPEARKAVLNLADSFDRLGRAAVGRCPAAGESTLNPLRTQGRSRGYSASISPQPKAMPEQNDAN
jgi:hypothetical protein